MPRARPTHKVLVVDDDEVIRQLICINLELEGFDVLTAVDGEEGLATARTEQPDVVTLDVMMPKMDGWEAAARLRGDPATAGIRVCLISARAQQADVAHGQRIGVDAYVTKPFDPEELVSVIRRLASQRC